MRKGDEHRDIIGHGMRSSLLIPLGRIERNNPRELNSNVHDMIRFKLPKQNELALDYILIQITYNSWYRKQVYCIIR